MPSAQIHDRIRSRSTTTPYRALWRIEDFVGLVKALLTSGGLPLDADSVMKSIFLCRAIERFFRYRQKGMEKLAKDFVPTAIAHLLPFYKNHTEDLVMQ